MNHKTSIQTPFIKTLGLLGLLALPAESMAGESCEVRILSDIPVGVALENLRVEAYGTSYPVTSRQLELCLKKSDLGFSAVKFYPTRLSLQLLQEQQRVVFFDALAHLQADEIRLDSVSSMAADACPSTCGFYEYQRLKQEPAVQRAAQLHRQNVVTNPATWSNREARQPVYTELSELLDGVYEASLPSIQPADSPPELEVGYFVDYSSGAWRYFRPYTDKRSLFQDKFMAGMQQIREADHDDQFREAFKAFSSELRAAYRSDLDWPEYQAGIMAIADEMRREAALEPLWQMTGRTIAEVEEQTEGLLMRHDVPFAALGARELAFGELLAHWGRNAYAYAEYPDKFQALFSERFKREDMHELLNDRALDRSLSRLLARINRAAMADLDAGFRRLLHEYHGQGERRGDRYEFADGLERLRFVYEKGAWRLDSVEINLEIASPPPYPLS
ncbi:hypothetical protein [Parahaliea mediterranea]|uniref:Uncharacterized protein n=1 Tax=Parahaliea mediterranea TaxID=651086 RepID=A0A939ILP3_9GAMM|nr:hypothetical protein [Parahaliea mediterranea]MBN7796188.1 hypothetical protein [Parahaliea mediterranea]